MKKFNVEAVKSDLQETIQKKIDTKTKPLGSLGKLEEIAFKIASIQETVCPEIKMPALIVFAADHGLARSGVSAFPQEVTYQMVLNFVGGGAAINIFTEENGIDLSVVDAGVNFKFDKSLPILNKKIAFESKNILDEPAMTEAQCEKAMGIGAELVEERYQRGTNLIAFGEMGIGNTAIATLLMSQVCKLPIRECTGRGTGLDDSGVAHKVKILESCFSRHGNIEDPVEMLATYGGFEIAMMVGAILSAAQKKMIIVMDGFIVTSALLVAMKINENVLDYILYSHQSEESGHQKMIEFLGGDPILQMNMRLGEGTGAALVLPIIQSAVSFFNKMASFEDASVSQKESK